MSAREWKPGDVAWIKGDGMDTLAIRTAEGAWAWVDTRGSNPVRGLCLCSSDADGRATPVAVVAYEDREQVGQLAALFHIERVKNDRDAIIGGSTDAMQAALREFADPKPPKPEEPTGLGAVVEAADGRRWVRSKLITTVCHWKPAEGGTRKRWSDLPRDLRVLSPGVEVDQ